MVVDCFSVLVLLVHPSSKVVTHTSRWLFPKNRVEGRTRKIYQNFYPRAGLDRYSHGDKFSIQCWNSNPEVVREFQTTVSYTFYCVVYNVKHPNRFIEGKRLRKMTMTSTVSPQAEEISSNQPTSMNLLFVGDLSHFCTEKDLAGVFMQFGPIISTQIRKGRSGDSLMHGFVELEEISQAQKAIEVLNDSKFMGRRMR